MDILQENRIREIAGLPLMEAKADPLGDWIVHKDGKLVKKFKTREGAKKWLEKSGDGHKISSAEYFQDKIQGKPIAESSASDEFYVDLDDSDDMYHVFDSNGKSHGSYSAKSDADKLAADRNSSIEKPKSEKRIKESGEKLSIDDEIENLKQAIKHETPRSVPGEDHTIQYDRHAKKIAEYRAELKKLMAQKAGKVVKEASTKPSKNEFQATLDKTKVTVLGYKFGAGEILRALEPDAFNEKYTAYCEENSDD